MKNWLPLFALVFCMYSTGWAQLPSIMLMDGKKSMKIPFTYYYNFVLVEAKLNGVIPVTLIFDTGAENTVLFDLHTAQNAGAVIDGKVQLMGADQSTPIDAYVCRQLNLYFPKLGFSAMDVIVLQDEVYNLKEITGRDIHGVLGANFFRGMIVQINYHKKHIKITRPERFSPPDESWRELPLTVIQDKPYLNLPTVVEKGKKIDLLYLMDSGAAVPTMLHNNSHAELNLPEKHIRGHLGSGLGGPLMGYVGRIEQIDWGPYEIKNLISGFQTLDSARLSDKNFVRNGLLGNPTLRRFETILDFAREKVYYRKSKYFDDETGVDRSGALLYATGENHNRFFIKSILPNSPAAKAGLQAGDQLSKIGRWPAHWFSLSNISRRFQKKPGTTIPLTVLRNGEKIKTVVLLDDII